MENELSPGALWSLIVASAPQSAARIRWPVRPLHVWRAGKSAARGMAHDVDEEVIDLLIAATNWLRSTSSVT